MPGLMPCRILSSSSSAFSAGVSTWKLCWGAPWCSSRCTSASSSASPILKYASSCAAFCAASISARSASMARSSCSFLRSLLSISMRSDMTSTSPVMSCNGTSSNVIPQACISSKVSMRGVPTNSSTSLHPSAGAHAHGGGSGTVQSLTKALLLLLEGRGLERGTADMWWMSPCTSVPCMSVLGCTCCGSLVAFIIAPLLLAWLLSEVLPPRR
mmetsp:Transcript_13486/g.36517  ORF Transcript_13486/g.36517 Transcript_13486/m.36517 type:complete len:213 (+) Transcript_13486:5227-5865(+)